MRKRRGVCSSTYRLQPTVSSAMGSSGSGDRKRPRGVGPVHSRDAAVPDHMPSESRPEQHDSPLAQDRVLPASRREGKKRPIRRPETSQRNSPPVQPHRPMRRVPMPVELRPVGEEVPVTDKEPLDDRDFGTPPSIRTGPQDNGVAEIEQFGVGIGSESARQPHCADLPSRRDPGPRGGVNGSDDQKRKKQERKESDSQKPQPRRLLRRCCTRRQRSVHDCAEKIPP
jgi:hypothetical protein